MTLTVLSLLAEQRTSFSVARERIHEPCESSDCVCETSSRFQTLMERSLEPEKSSLPASARGWGPIRGEGGGEGGVPWEVRRAACLRGGWGSRGGEDGEGGIPWGGEGEDHIMG